MIDKSNDFVDSGYNFIVQFLSNLFPLSANGTGLSLKQAITSDLGNHIIKLYWKLCC